MSRTVVATVSGIAGVYRHEEWANSKPERPMEGCYVGRRKSHHASEIPCPFCAQLLREVISDDAARIVKIEREQQGFSVGLSQLVPKTHRMLGCGTCGVGFTVPRDRGPCPSMKEKPSPRARKNDKRGSKSLRVSKG